MDSLPSLAERTVTLKTQILTVPYKGQTLCSGDPDFESHNFYDFLGTVLEEQGFMALEEHGRPPHPDAVARNYGVFHLEIAKIPHWRDGHRPQGSAAANGETLSLLTQLSCCAYNGTAHCSGEPDSDSHNSYHLLSDLINERFAVLERDEIPHIPDHFQHQHGAFLVTVKKVPHWRDELRLKRLRLTQGIVSPGTLSRPSALAERCRA